MLEPIFVTISHRLGRDGARRRIEDGLTHIHGRLAPFASTMEWTDDRLDFTVIALHQTVNGHIEIEESLVRVELGRPSCCASFPPVSSPRRVAADKDERRVGLKSARAH